MTVEQRIEGIRADILAIEPREWFANNVAKIFVKYDADILFSPEEQHDNIIREVTAIYAIDRVCVDRKDSLEAILASTEDSPILLDNQYIYLQVWD